MKALRVIALVLVAGGLSALVYGGFDYPKSHEAKLGPVAFNMKTQEHVSVPVWAGVGAIVAGVLLLLVPRKKR
ncbi:MAG TPA: hypothetical protein VHL57_11190 [Flavobacteriales bacterium]|jgi:hypothetical protein|nr:hypothetical protein [Flavobacteriales bacterium]